jgi:hypothetical protein
MYSEEETSLRQGGTLRQWWQGPNGDAKLLAGGNGLIRAGRELLAVGGMRFENP